jgi:hypothetical protein
MKKTIVFLLVLTTTSTIFAQKMMTRSGVINFEASMPALEEIAAKNNAVSCLFDKSTGDFVALVLVKAFRFKVPLMEEHFNENYLESELYPKATFKGKIVGFDAAKLNAGKQVFDVAGDLTLHGVTQKVTTQMTFTPSGEKMLVAGTFSVKPKDYKIEIPSFVKSKIAEVVNLSLRFELENK